MILDDHSQGLALLAELASTIGEAVDLTDEQADQYLKEHILNQPLSSDSFYTVMNLKKQALTFSHGCGSFFGIDELTYPYFFNQILEPYRNFFLAYGAAVYASAFDPANKKMVQPLKQEYRTMIPLRNRAGKFYWVTQVSFPLQLDKDHNLISHLNIYRVGLAYNNWEKWAIKGEMLEKNLPNSDFAVKMEQYFKDFLGAMFGPRKIEILHLYARGSTTNEIASRLSISKKTVYTHNKDILDKSNRLLYSNYSNVKDVAAGLLANGYL